jgi:hypothetical protein
MRLGLGDGIIERMAAAKWVQPVLSLSFFWLVACGTAGGGAATPGGVSGSAATIGCAKDPRADTYSADLTKHGDSGAFTFVLVDSQPAPPAIDSNTWTLRLLDAVGNPVTDATFPQIKTWMPDHGHGSSAIPQAQPSGDGTYTIQPLYLFMNGLWQVTFTAQSGSTTDSAMFSFCIGG